MYSYANVSREFSYGPGYCINPIIGMIVLAQWESEIPDEEYAERMAGINKQARLAALN